MSRDLVFLLIGIGATIALSGPFLWIVRERWFRLKRRISWRSFYSKLSNPNLRAAIEIDGRRPDIIIGVNSGIVPAAILAYNYQICDLIYVLSMPIYNASWDRQCHNIHFPKVDITEKYVLIVDDQYYSGDTIRAVREEVGRLPGADHAMIKTFAIFAYDTPARPVRLDIQPLGKVQGVLAKAPWVFSQDLERHYLERNRKETLK